MHAISADRVGPTQHASTCCACLVFAPAGQFYTLTTGANERRWGKMKNSLEAVAKSFAFIN